VVSAFEQSLSNMTQRLQHLTSTAERKVMKQEIRRQSSRNVNFFTLYERSL
jgi:hypothetical protein